MQLNRNVFEMDSGEDRTERLGDDLSIQVEVVFIYSTAVNIQTYNHLISPRLNPVLIVKF